jgi:hypothetical protein
VEKISGISITFAALLNSTWCLSVPLVMMGTHIMSVTSWHFLFNHSTLLLHGWCERPCNQV